MFRVRLLGAILAMSQLTAVHGWAQQYAFQEDADNQGLNSLTINCLLQDHMGIVWVCTENGLYKFDGSSYTRLGAEQGLQDSYILSIHQDADNELWVGTSSGLYHGDGHHFTAAAQEIGGLAGGSGQQITSTGPGHVLAVSRHRIFELSRAGPSAGSNATWKVAPFSSQAWLDTHPDLASIYSIFVSRDGSVWAGCGNAVCQFSASGVKAWSAADGVVPDTWAWFLEDSTGRLWARGYHHILALSPHAARFVDQNIPSTSVTFSTPLLPVVEDTQHRILTRTDSGMAILDQGHWQTLGAANGLDVPGILALMVDRDGTLWLGTYGKGVERWMGNGNWETWAAGQGLEGNLVWSMVRDHLGTIWAATEHGIVTLDRAGKRFLPWQPNATVPHGQVISVRQGPDQSLWFSSSAGQLIRYSPDQGGLRNWTMPGGLRWIWANTSNQLWGMTNSGLYRFDTASNEIAKVENPVVQDQAFFDVCEDAGHGLWFASNRGIVHLSDGIWSQITVRGNVTSDRFGSVACAADGTLWLGGASTGVEHLRVQGDVASAAEPLPPAGFKSIEPMFLHQDHRGWLWIGSGSGVYVYNGTRWRHLTKNDGLVWNDCNEGAFLEDVDGSVWIGTSNGLSHLLHPEMIFQQQPLRVIVTSAELGNHAISPGSTPSLAWTKEPLRVQVVSSPLEDQPSTVYRYRLVGLEQDWNTTRSHDLRYSSLPDGAYRLEIYAEDTESDARSPLVVLSFRVRPPWWNSLLFQIGLTSSLLLFAFGAIHFRERELIASKVELEALISERTEQLQLEKQQMAEAREALRELASRDPLTGLLNRRAIYDVLSREMARVSRDGTALTAVMIDLDHFKEINDTHGHMVGDEVLREIGRRLTDAVRSYDNVSRYGGEEFLLLMPDIDASMSQARLLRVHSAICCEPIRFPGGEVSLTCSLGVSILLGDQSLSVEQFLDRADRALYEAKRKGRNRIAYAAHSLVG